MITRKTAFSNLSKYFNFYIVQYKSKPDCLNFKIINNFAVSNSFFRNKRKVTEEKIHAIRIKI